ncbi:MAG: tetratricopeptide repeat protein [Pseudomonadota bacterium]
MSKSLISAIALGLVLAGGISVSTSAAEKPTVSKAAQKPLKAAQDAMKAQKYDDAIAKANEALALPGKTAFDSYVSYQVLVFSYLKKGNTAKAAESMEAELATGLTTPAEEATINKALASIAYQQQNYAKAAESYNKLIKSGAGDAESYTMVAQSYYLMKNYKEACKFLTDYIGDQEKRGQTPKEQSLQLYANSCEKANENSAASNAQEKLVVYYPKPAYWNGLLYSVLRAQGITDRQTLNVYRLMQETKTLAQPSDYTEMAQLAMEAGTPGEAQKVLEQGFAANVFTDQRVKDRTQRLLDTAKKAAATDQTTLAKSEVEAKAAKTGDADVALGSAYLSYGQNDKAIEALTRGLAKGGLKTPEGQIMLGIAQLRSGNKAEAQKTFKAVKSDDATWSRVAKLWVLDAS